MNITPALDNTATCLNLRPAPDGTALCPVGLPATIATGNLRPLHVIDHPDGTSTLFLTTGNFLLSLYLTGDNPQPQSLALLPSEAVSAVSTGYTLLVMTAEGPFRLDYNAKSGTWKVLGLLPSFPVINLRAVTSPQFTATVPSRTLTGGYTRCEGTLSDDDTAAVTADMLSLYSQVAEKALFAGHYMQPVIARYKLFDRDGATLYESAPVMITPEGGFQGTAAVESQLTAVDGIFSAVASRSLTVAGFRIGFDLPEIPASPWNEVVASLKVYVSPQLHPVDYSTEASCRLEENTASAGILRAYIPGMADAMTADTARRRSLVERMTADFYAHATVVADIPYPFVSGLTQSRYPQKAVYLRRPDYKSATKECAELSRLLAGKSSATGNAESRLLRAMSLPNSFCAEVATAAGDLVAYGAITPLRYTGYPAPMVAASTGDGAWRANVKVTFGDGSESVVWHGEGTKSAPLSFSPLLTYPAADALEMTLTVEYADGSVLSRTVALTAMAGISVYIDETFAPIAPDTVMEAYVIPAAMPAPHCRRQAVAIARASQLLSPTAVAIMAQGGVKAIAPAVRSSSAWDFARAHLYSFTTAGIYAVAVNAARDALSVNVIDRRGVERGDAVTTAGDGVCAIASGDLVSVAGSKAVTLQKKTGTEAIAWCAPFGELWCVDAAHAVTIRLPDGTSFRRDISADEILPAQGGRLFLRSGESLLDASREVPADAMPILWSTRVRAATRSSPPQRPVLISWHLFASTVKLELSMLGDNGAGSACAMPMIRHKVTGAINAPLTSRVYAPPRLCFTLTASGTASPDTRLTHLAITFKN